MLASAFFVGEAFGFALDAGIAAMRPGLFARAMSNDGVLNRETKCSA